MISFRRRARACPPPRCTDGAIQCAENTATKTQQRAGKTYDVMVCYSPQGTNLATIVTNDLGVKSRDGAPCPCPTLTPTPSARLSQPLLPPLAAPAPSHS